MRNVPINCAETIIEPFWDPQQSGLREWAVEPGAGRGLEVKQAWCFAAFSWQANPAAGPALRMGRRFALDVAAAFDRLVVSAALPERSVLSVTVRTDRGEVVHRSGPAPAGKAEHTVNLSGALRIEHVGIEVWPEADGPVYGWFNWIGLQSTALLPVHLAQWRELGEGWDAFLKPADAPLSFTPRYGLLIDGSELDRMRADHDAFVARHGSSPFTRAADEAARLQPERMVAEFVNFWTDTRYCRQRDEGNVLLRHGPAAAVAGLLARDASQVRLGARLAVAIALSANWDDGMICRFPGSTFEHRCFVQSLCAYECAILLDLAGEVFTDVGRELLLRRIAEEGIGSITYITLRHEYIFTCNQLAWFSPGRVAGLAVLERHYPRAAAYRDIARRELLESLEATVLGDGGYVEGPTYFRCVGRDGGLSLFLDARASGRAFRDAIPPSMLRTAAFGAAIESTDDAADAIPICDGRPLMEQEALAVMAHALPESRWAAMFAKSVRRGGGMPETVLAWQLGRAALSESAAVPAPSLVVLPEMGIAASHRSLGGAMLKIFLMGNRGGAGHTHEDKGSFVVELAGETLAFDPGTCDYSSPLAEIVKHCQRHSMLVPVGSVHRLRPASPLPGDVKPACTGDGCRFEARLDASTGWEGTYRRWVRTWDSPGPDTLVVRDEYEVQPGAGTGVEWYWQTEKAVEVRGRTVTVRGVRALARLEVPADCTVRVDELPLYGGRLQRRVAICRPDPAGSIEVRVSLSVGASPAGQ
jgi:hypothetical protein